MDNIFQKVCEKTTKHKLREFEAYSLEIEPTEYHYRCKICGKTFWNYNKPKNFDEKVKEWG